MANFQIQKSGSTVNWTGKKVLGLHTGNIDLAGGHIEWDEENILGGEIVMDMTSINITDIDDPKTNQDFKNHLFNDDFFSIENHPTSHLRINKSTALENNQYKIDGTLT